MKGCGGFDDKNYHEGFLKDGYLVKVLGKRISVYHTAWYQLHHSSVDVTKKRFQVATWFGVCSYRKLKLTPEKRKALCPICRHDLVEHDYHGRNNVILAVLRSNRGSCEMRKGYADLEEDGRRAWVERVKREWSSES